MYETFVSGPSASQQEQLGDWLPDLLSGKTSVEKTAAKHNKKDEAALKALAKDHEIDIKASGFLGGEVVDRLRLQSGTQNASDIKLLEHEIFEAKFEEIFKTNYRTDHDVVIRAGRTWEWAE